MRRGHPGISGWRGENPRHFRPRGGIQQHYRPPRNYAMPEIPRFASPAPGPRMHRPAHFSTNSDEYRPRDHQERKPYRGVNHKSAQQRSHDRSRFQNKSGMRQILPFIQQTRHKENHGSYVEDDFYTENLLSHTGHVNNMGDVDLRHQASAPQHHNSFTNPHVNASWNNQQQKNRQHYENRSPQKNFRPHVSLETNKKPLLDYPGHRPPASDYYGGTPTTITSANNTSFSRSVDDTVDIVRKRLMHRNESQSSQEDNTVINSHSDLTAETNTYPATQSGQTPKKKILPPKPTVKSNCDKMKNKIVHQLFKMDKDKIHKLMDNPNSSTKFEYAISSLITESQNSLNRHLRSIAEKSLCSSSEDFINNDNNTIYEDTFMKQMQCILDPQDTILLEDIKPLVMAELTKVLQLDEIDQTHAVTDIERRPDVHNLTNEHSDYAYPESYNYEEYPQDIYCDIKEYVPNEFVENASNSETNSNYDFSISYQQDAKPLFERRQAKRIDYEEERKRSSDSRHSRKSIDIKPAIDVHSIYNFSQEPTDLFNVDCEQMSEDDDPFAELDKQYHVPVDHNFIELDDIENTQAQIYNNKLSHTENDSANSTSILDTLDESFASLHGEVHDTAPPSITKEEQQSKTTAITAKPSVVLAPNLIESIDNKTDYVPKTKSLDNKEPDKSTSAGIKSSSNSRKRSIDQQPSHRKEKRKKSESSPSDHNKNVSIKVVNELSAKNTATYEDSTKTALCLFSQQNASCKGPIKDNKRSRSVDKGYSDKYVKRKDSRKKSIDTKTPKKRTTSISGHSSISPKENTSSGQITTQEAKAKLQTIDIFTTKPKKMNFHHAHRNTALIQSSVKSFEKDKSNPQIGSNILKDNNKSTKKLQSKETQTFESKISTSRYCQTERKQLVVKSIQTEPVTFEKSKVKSKDAFERMKEIDLEIQVLLQEKFQLYSSIESKDSGSNSMQDLGMTVLNVAPYDETKEDDNSLENVLTGDAIVDDFTSIPVEELEQIALETVQEEEEEENAGRYEKRTRRMTQKLLDQESNTVGSPTTSKRSNKKIKTPNISLLEQIITDDRPLEDIIVLDELETTPVKTTKKKPQRNKQTKKKLPPRTKSKPLDIPSNNLRACSVMLCRINVSPYLDKEESGKDKNKKQIPDTECDILIDKVKPEEPQLSTVEVSIPEPTEIVEEAVVNDLQFDMLDVSEDIVIEEISDNNLLERDLNDRNNITINQEIILGNSQSSSDDVYVTESVQEETECKMYDYSNDENLRRDSVTVTGNGDAVLAIECIENNFIAACLDGNVYYFSGDGQLINTLRGSNLAVTCLTIVKEKHGTTVYTGSLDSRIRYYDLDTGVEKGPECNVLSPIQTMDRAWDTVFVGTRTGFVLQFECKNNMLIPVSTVKFSEQSILALRAMKEGPRKVLLVAARSENVTVKDAQTGLLLRTLSGPKMTVYALLFEDGKVYCGTSSHQIHVFDYATGGHVGSHEGGKGAVCLRATGGLVFAGCYDGCVYVYREGETRPLAQLRGPSLMLLSLAVVGSKIIAGFKDRSLYIWKIPLSILQEMIL